MKTKKIYIFILSGILTLLSNSCSKDFLDAEPITSITDINYYTTPDEAEQALVGCYDALQLIWSGGIAFPLASDVMSDLCFGGTGTNDADQYPMIDEYDKTVDPGKINLFEDNWRDYYKGINRCNTLISKMGQINWTGMEDKKGIVEGEARFLRAFFYFDLVRMFERVPLLTKPTSDNVPQANPDDTYKLISQDLIFAIENCSDAKYASIPKAEFGHATKWAAEALLARVFLYYTGYYNQTSLVDEVTQADALAYLEDIISNSGHALVDTFAYLWPAASTYKAAIDGRPISDNHYAGETNIEVVFAIKYTYTSDYAPGPGEPDNVDGGHWIVMNGLRKQSEPKYGYGNGWGACTVVPEFYANWDPNDQRRDASIMGVAEENIDFPTAKIQDVKEYSGYFTKKYTPTCDENGQSIAADIYGGVNFMIAQFQDYFSIRFADVLLMAAELGSPDALNYVNQVHTRAGLDPLSSVDKDIIFEERKYEFAFEGIRYWDLLRYDHTLDYAANAVTYTGTLTTNNIEFMKTIDGNNLKLTRGLFQIPNNQITLSNGVLIQNAGWD